MTLIGTGYVATERGTVWTATPIDTETAGRAGAQTSQSRELLPPRSQREIDVSYRKSGRPLGTARDVRRAFARRHLAMLSLGEELVPDVARRGRKSDTARLSPSSLVDLVFVANR